MTFKAAAAGLDLGGGKGVICAPSTEPPTGAEREALLLDFGDLVESLGGRYITAEDVGTSPEDMVVIASRTRHVTGMPAEHGGAGDPSPFTATGVQAAMRAAALFAFGTLGPRRDGGSWSAASATWARSSPAASRTPAPSSSSPTSTPRKRAVAEALGARVGRAGGGARDRVRHRSRRAPSAARSTTTTSTRLRCRIVCGAANNQLADEALAETLAERGILYAPDFIANAGGLINVYRELHSFSEERAMELALAIENTMARILAPSRARGHDAARRGARPRSRATRRPLT